MKRTKLAKKGKTNIITADDREQIEAIYAGPATYVSGCYLTPAMLDKTTFVRVTFSEYNFTLQKHMPRVAVVTSIEDLQIIYNAITTLLQNMREMGRIQ